MWWHRRGSTRPPFQPAPIAPVPSVSKEKSGPSGLHLYVVGVDKQRRKRIAALGGPDLRKHPSRRYRSTKERGADLPARRPFLHLPPESRLQTRCSLAIFVVLKIRYLLLYLDTLPS
jgi:hypothetical protein